MWLMERTAESCPQVENINTIVSNTSPYPISTWSVGFHSVLSKTTFNKATIPHPANQRNNLHFKEDLKIIAKIKQIQSLGSQCNKTNNFESKSPSHMFFFHFIQQTKKKVPFFNSKIKIIIFPHPPFQRSFSPSPSVKTQPPSLPTPGGRSPTRSRSTLGQLASTSRPPSSLQRSRSSPMSSSSTRPTTAPSPQGSRHPWRRHRWGVLTQKKKMWAQNGGESVQISYTYYCWICVV